MRFVVSAVVILISLFANALEPQALVSVAIASLRSAPAHSAEMETQLLMGTPVCVTDTAGEWCRIVAPDGYEAYIPTKALVVLDESALKDWRNSDRVIVTSPRQSIIFADTISGQVLSPAFPGMVLTKESGPHSRCVTVTLPDGRKGFISSADVEDFEQWSRRPASRDEIIAFAKALMGTPYLWGGGSPAGIDCSGFTQLCYFMGGRMLLPRNASAQAARDGQIEEPLADADLVFMGNEQGSNRISHVGMYCDGDLIHSSGQVKIDHDFLNPSASFPRKIIKTTSPLLTPTPISIHPWYF